MTIILVAAAILASLLLGAPATGVNPTAAATSASGSDALSGNGPPG